jgi:hypothetical protein
LSPTTQFPEITELGIMLKKSPIVVSWPIC